jgi:peptide/nickel transport system substrate-binding protein
VTIRRRTLLRGAAAAPAVALVRPATGQDMRARTLRFVPQANLTSLDAI